MVWLARNHAGGKTKEYGNLAQLAINVNQSHSS